MIAMGPLKTNELKPNLVVQKTYTKKELDYDFTVIVRHNSGKICIQGIISVLKWIFNLYETVYIWQEQLDLISVIFFPIVSRRYLMFYFSNFLTPSQFFSFFAMKKEKSPLTLGKN